MAISPDEGLLLGTLLFVVKDKLSLHNGILSRVDKNMCLFIG